MITRTMEYVIIGSPTRHRIKVNKLADGYGIAVWPGNGDAVVTKLSFEEMLLVMEWVTQQPVPH